jgi:hypothetical protein
MSGRVVRKLTELLEEARAPREERRMRRTRRRREAHDERLAQKAAADAEARRVPYNYPGGGSGGFGAG